MYFMRTTVEIEESTFRRTKALASLRGISLKDLFNQALERELERDAAAIPQRRRIGLPLVPSSSPGTLHLDAERIQKILDEEDQDAATRH